MESGEQRVVDEDRVSPAMDGWVFRNVRRQLSEWEAAFYVRVCDLCMQLVWTKDTTGE